MNRASSWLPQRINNQQGQERSVGIEVEFAGLSSLSAAGCIQQQFGGEVQIDSDFEIHISNTVLGDFKLELDSSQLKQLSERLSQPSKETFLEVKASELIAKATEQIARAAEQIVPWEIVTPPIPLSHLQDIQYLLITLREQGALGTRHALHYAFGVHLNPELPDLTVATILNYLRAYFCLYDWIVEQEKIDFTRRLTPYINHFDKAYIQKLLKWDYEPNQATLIDDYLAANPTRNRSMDMLPLFSHLDEPRVKNVVVDERVNGRPTLHYRLPNCDIDNPEWSLIKPWQEWLQVESLAHNSDKLEDLCGQYLEYLNSFGSHFSNEWLNKTYTWIEKI